MRLLLFPLQAAPRTCRYPTVSPLRAWQQQHEECQLERRRRQQFLKGRGIECRRQFTTSRACCQHEIGKHRNHYENLNVPYDASPADIKKSFYSLSKEHHPDRNPGDPSAASRFHSISEAYATLGTPAKRTAYDRDVLRSQAQSHGRHPGSGNAAPRGSYHSAGGRPASGLSRRRSTFRGPPPSFFRNGGWGAHGHKRNAAHEESTGTWSNDSSTSSSSSSTNPDRDSSSSNPRDAGWTHNSSKAGMGPGQDPFGHTMDPNIPHFDRAGHHRTQRTQDHRRAQRVWREGQSSSSSRPGAQESTASMFVTVSGVLFMTFFLPYAFFGGFRKKKGDEEEDKKAKKAGKKQKVQQQQQQQQQQASRKKQQVEKDEGKDAKPPPPPPSPSRDETPAEPPAIPVAEKP